MPQLRHIASALGVPCSSFRCVVQWPYSVAEVGGYVPAAWRNRFYLQCINDSVIISDICSVVWLDEREKRLGKDVEGNGHGLIRVTVPVF
jgi:hypothetical protein